MFEWTGVNVQILRDLWGEHSAGYIAGVIGNPSRNSVLGKAHRLGLMEKGARSQPNLRTRATPFRKPYVQRSREVLNTGAASPQPSSRVENLLGRGECDPLVTSDCSRPGSPSCTLMDLTSGTCRWPMWTDANPERLYCGADGADMENKRPYCPVHSQMAYQPRRAT